MSVPCVILNNGIEMPAIGIGSFSLRREEISRAISVGYRHIDTAKHYQNENEVGIAVKKSGIDRSEFFITTKIMRPDLRERKAKESFEDSLQLLQMDYVDLYLIHFPPEEILESSWHDMEELYETGRIRAIGVSNYDINDLKSISKVYNVKPAVNQICSHPYKKNNAIMEYCNELGIQIEAYSPLGGNSTSKELLRDSRLNRIADKYHVSIPQLIIRWDYQRGIVSIPRSSSEVHMRQNLEVFDIIISDIDMNTINSIEEEMVLR